MEIGSKMATLLQEKNQKWTLKNVFSQKFPIFLTFETSSWILTSNRSFWPAPMYRDINFVLKCLPAQCAMFSKLLLHVLQLGIAGFKDCCSPEYDWKLLWLSPLCLWKCMDLVTVHNVTVVVLPLVVNIVLCCTFCMETQILALPANPCYVRGGGGRCTTQEVSRCR